MKMFYCKNIYIYIDDIVCGHWIIVDLDLLDHCMFYKDNIAGSLMYTLQPEDLRLSYHVQETGMVYFV